jgi:hypothetical protein
MFIVSLVLLMVSEAVNETNATAVTGTNVTAAPVQVPKAANRTHTRTLKRTHTRTRPRRPAPPTNRSSARTKTISLSLPFQGGVLRWIDNVTGVPFPAGYLPVIQDVDLNVVNVTLALRLYHDQFRTQPGALTTTEIFESINISLPFAGIQQNRGVIGRITSGALVTKDSIRMQSTDLWITLMADSFLQLRVDETVSIEILPKLVASRIRPQNALYFQVKAQRFPRDASLVTGVIVTNALAAAGLLLGGVPGSHENQAVAMIGGMSCIDRTAATFTDGAEYVLAPTPFFSDPHGRLAGNMFLGAEFFLCHVIACFVIRKKVSDIGTFEVRSRLMFPSISFALTMLLFPGSVYYAVRSTYNVVGGAITIMILFGFIAALSGVIWMVKFVWSHPYFLRRQFLNALPDDSFIGRLLSPSGRWTPFAVLQQYRAVIGEIDSRSTTFIFLPFIQPAIVAVVSGFEGSSRSECYAQFGALTILYLVCALLYVLKRPYRYLLQNIFSAFNCLALSVLTIACAVNDPQKTPLAYKGGLGLMFALVLIRTAYTVFTARKEWKLTAPDRRLDPDPPLRRTNKPESPPPPPPPRPRGVVNASPIPERPRLVGGPAYGNLETESEREARLAHNETVLEQEMERVIDEEVQSVGESVDSEIRL